MTAVPSDDGAAVNASRHRCWMDVLQHIRPAAVSLACASTVRLYMTVRGAIAPRTVMYYSIAYC